MKIRPARPTDEPAVRDCAARAYGRYVSRIGRKPPPMVADFAALIAQGIVHVAETDGTVTGYIVFYPRGDHMHLENVAVLPEAAGQGVGTALIQFCEDTARAKGLKAVELFTHAKMTENHAIYPHFGYTETDRREDEGLPRVFFRKILS